MSRRTEKCPTCKGAGLITVDDWLVKGMTEEELAKKKEEALADIVEVVRCKDCKHHPDNGGECDRSITHTGRDYVCECNTYRYIGIDYCSYGERREGW